MIRGDGRAKRLASRLQAAAALTLALGIFALDALTPLQGAVAVLYTTVILVAGRNRNVVIAVGAVCAFLAIIAYFISHFGAPLDSAAMRLAVSLVAIGITTALIVQHHADSEERRRSDQRYRAIFNAAGFPIWESDWSAAFTLLQSGAEPGLDIVRQASQASRIRDANHAAALLFGYPNPESLVGRNIVDHYVSATEAALMQVFAALMRGDKVIEKEVQFQSLSGEGVDVVLRVTLPPEHQGWKRVLVMALDVTERNRIQARLAQSQAALAHVSRVTTLGQLAASIAHEVNQPLSAIITYAKSGQRWLAREAPAAAEVADCLDHIASNGTRAADVIARIRDLARKADPKLNWIDLPFLTEETAALLHRELQASEIVLSITAGPDLPAILGDRVQIQQVLMNLILNAEQAMADTLPEKRELCVDITADREVVTVQVRDCGMGIAAVDPESLFNPFVTTKPDGMGMGLSICRTIIEQHGGTLTAVNNPQGKGATFLFRLPVPGMQERSVA